MKGNMYGEEEKCVESFDGETGSKRQLGKARHSLDNITMEQDRSRDVISENF